METRTFNFDGYEVKPLDFHPSYSLRFIDGRAVLVFQVRLTRDDYNALLERLENGELRDYNCGVVVTDLYQDESSDCWAVLQSDSFVINFTSSPFGPVINAKIATRETRQRRKKEVEGGARYRGRRLSKVEVLGRLERMLGDMVEVCLGERKLCRELKGLEGDQKGEALCLSNGLKVPLTDVLYLKLPDRTMLVNLTDDEWVEVPFAT